MLDALWVGDQVSAPEKEPYPNDITVLLGHGQPKTQRVALDIFRTSKEEMTLRTWRTLAAWQQSPFGCCSAWFRHLSLSYRSFSPICRFLITDAEGARQVFFLDLLQRLERLGDMFLRRELREEDATDNALPIDDIRHTARESEGCRDAIALSDQAIGVAQQEEGEVVRCGELPMGLHRV